MTNRTLVAWRRLGAGFAASVVMLAISVFGAIAVVSAPTSQEATKAGLLGFDPTGLHQARTPTSSPTPLVTRAPTPAPTPGPTPEPAPAEAPLVTEAPIPRPAAVTPPTPAPPVQGYRNDIAQSLLTLLNNIRAQSGVGTVAANGTLTATAEYYTKLHFTTADPYRLNHYLDGGPGDRAWARGYCCAVGEILVTSQGSAEEMVQLWMDSPPHRAVILDGQYREIGVACYGGEYRSPEGSVGYPILCAAEFGSGG